MLAQGDLGMENHRAPNIYKSDY